MTDTFIIGSSNARRVFGENYAGNFLKIGNPEKALSSHGEKEIRNFLKNITINSVIVIPYKPDAQIMPSDALIEKILLLI